MYVGYHENDLWTWALGAEALRPETTACAVALLVMGPLCAAAGIGGGGVIVALLMHVGQLEPHDAVPVSKAVVFMGALISLFMNLGQNWRASTKQPSSSSSSSSSPPSLRSSSSIDWEICRLMVPPALLGTLFGVTLNRQAPPWLIVAILVIVLLGMTAMLVQKAWTQYVGEEAEAHRRGDMADAHDDDEAEGLLEAPSSSPRPSPSPPLLQSKPAAAFKGGPLTQQDALLMGTMLVGVVLGGTLRYQAEACNKQPMSGLEHKGVCSKEAGLTSIWQLQSFIMVVPVFACAVVSLFYTAKAVRQQHSTLQRAVMYQSIGLIAGLLAGLVGIGGGLIFSPFLILTGCDPAVAVATSSTCVLFTSSSTTLQYFLMGRILVAPALVYGVANAFASVVGTGAVQWVHSKFEGRRSCVSAIVALAVAVSAALSLLKAYEYAVRRGIPVAQRI